MLHVRTREPEFVGLRAGAASARHRSLLCAARHRRVRDPVCADARRLGTRAGGNGRRVLQHPFPWHARPVMFGASGAVPVFLLGNWWSILSATWLHGGLLHIAFNM